MGRVRGKGGGCNFDQHVNRISSIYQGGVHETFSLPVFARSPGLHPSVSDGTGPGVKGETLIDFVSRFRCLCVSL